MQWERRYSTNKVARAQFKYEAYRNRGAELQSQETLEFQKFMYRELSFHHPLIGGSISQYSASARPHEHPRRLWMPSASSLWAQRIMTQVRVLPLSKAAKTRSPHYVRPRIQACATSWRAPYRSVSFRCSLSRSRRALPPEILCDKVRVYSRPCQDPRLRGYQRIRANRGWPKKKPYNFTKKKDILASNQKYAAHNVSVDFLDEDALNRILQD